MDRETPWTRIIEHKWLNSAWTRTGEIPYTVISAEYWARMERGDEP